jgi:hypothetical protein
VGGLGEDQLPRMSSWYLHLHPFCFQIRSCSEALGVKTSIWEFCSDTIQPIIWLPRILYCLLNAEYLTYFMSFKTLVKNTNIHSNIYSQWLNIYSKCCALQMSRGISRVSSRGNNWRGNQCLRLKR